ncbi:MAG TPA: FecR domain-containing protein [Rhodocyclaceae bacterium]|nr:FecR domain-containing protein [Rhodocyclaceae bacterium]HNH36191.1 FecR domain-containing protein [Rhodocyclaceae bacterium]
MNKLGAAGVALMAALAAGNLVAAEAAGTVKTVRGAVTVERGSQKVAAVPGMRVEAADRIATGPDGSVGITLRDQTMLTAGPNSLLGLDKYSFDSTTHGGELDANLKRGSLAVISGKLAKASPESVRFRTDSVTLGVRGTEFILEAAGGQ